MADITNEYIQNVLGDLSQILEKANPSCAASLHLDAAKPLVSYYDGLPPLSDPACELLMMIGRRAQQDYPELTIISEAFCCLAQDMLKAAQDAPYALESSDLERGSLLACLFSGLAVPRYSHVAVDPDKAAFLCEPLATLKRKATETSTYAGASTVLNWLNYSRQNGSGIMMPPVAKRKMETLPPALQTFVTRAVDYETRRAICRAMV